MHDGRPGCGRVVGPGEGLVSYGIDALALFKGAAGHVDRISGLLTGVEIRHIRIRLETAPAGRARMRSPAGGRRRIGSTNLD